MGQGASRRQHEAALQEANAQRALAKELEAMVAQLSGTLRRHDEAMKEQVAALEAKVVHTHTYTHARASWILFEGPRQSLTTTPTPAIACMALTQTWYVAACGRDTGMPLAPRGRVTGAPVRMWLRMWFACGP